MMKKARTILKQKETLRFAMKMQRNSVWGAGITYTSGCSLDDELALQREIEEIKRDLDD